MTVCLWSIQSKTVVDWQKTTDVITAIKFSPDATKLVVGLYRGKCSIYLVDSLKLTYVATVNCKNRHGAFSDGRKVTGISFINNIEALITTADSRLRIINLNVFQLLKY